MSAYLFVKHTDGQIDEYPVKADSILAVDGIAFSLSDVEKVWVAEAPPLDEPTEGVTGGIGADTTDVAAEPVVVEPAPADPAVDPAPTVDPAPAADPAPADAAPAADSPVADPETGEPQPDPDPQPDTTPPDPQAQ